MDSSLESFCVWRSKTSSCTSQGPVVTRRCWGEGSLVLVSELITQEVSTGCTVYRDTGGSNQVWDGILSPQVGRRPECGRRTGSVVSRRLKNEVHLGWDPRLLGGDSLFRWVPRWEYLKRKISALPLSRLCLITVLPVGILICDTSLVFSEVLDVTVDPSLLPSYFTSVNRTHRSILDGNVLYKLDPGLPSILRRCVSVPLSPKSVSFVFTFPGLYPWSHRTSWLFFRVPRLPTVRVPNWDESEVRKGLWGVCGGFGS